MNESKLIKNYSNVLEIEDVIQQNFLGIKFKKESLEKEFEAYLLKTSRPMRMIANSLPLIFMTLRAILHIRGKENPVKMVIDVCSSFLVILVFIIYHFLTKKAFLIKILNYVYSFMILMFSTYSVFSTNLTFKNNYKDVQMREIYLFLLMSLTELIYFFEFNLFFCIILFIWNLGIAFTITFINLQEDNERFKECFIFFLILIPFILLKRLDSLMLRKDFLKNYKLRNYFAYTFGFLDKMKSIMVTIKDKNLFIYNVAFKNYLLTSNLTKKILQTEFDKINNKEIGVYNMPTTFNEQTNQGAQTHFNSNILENNNKSPKIEKDENILDIERFYSENRKKMLTLEIFKKLANLDDKKNSSYYKQMAKNSPHKCCFPNDDFQISKINSFKINETYPIKQNENEYNPSRKIKIETNFTDEEERKHYIFSESKNELTELYLRNIKLMAISQDMYRYRASNLFDILNNINKLNIVDNKNEDFLYLGEFFIKQDSFYFQVYFRKNKEIKDLMDLFIYDMTSIKKAEEKEFKLKSQFFAKIAHEFKTPINSIISLINNLEYDNRVKLYNLDNILKSLSHIRSLSEYIILLINDIIEYSNFYKFNKGTISEDINYQQSDINPNDNILSNDENNKDKIKNVSKEKINIKNIIIYCQEILKALLIDKEKNKFIKAKQEFDENISNYEFYSNETKLKQILLNLISNAVKFTKAGWIEIKSSIVREKYNEWLKISVLDTGVGVSKEEIDLLLRDNRENDFLNNTRDYNKEGSGIGFYISKYLAEQLNHKINVEPNVKSGSIFSIFIKAHKIKNPFINSDWSLISENKDLNKLYTQNLFEQIFEKYFYDASLNKGYEKMIIDIKNIFEKEHSDSVTLIPKRHSHNNFFFSNTKINRGRNFLIEENNSNYSYFQEERSEKYSQKTKEFWNNNCYMFEYTKFAENNFNMSSINMNRIDKISNFSAKSISCADSKECNCVLHKNILRRRDINTSIDDVDIRFKSIPKVEDNDVIEKEEIYYFSEKHKNIILIIDDHKEIRESLKNLVSKILRKKNLLDLYITKEGRDGVDILHNVIYDQFENNRIKCILTDENMEYINGSDAIKIIRNLEKSKKIKPIIIASITAFEDEFNKSIIKSTGVNQIFAKPCSEKDLIYFFNEYKIFD